MAEGGQRSKARLLILMAVVLAVGGYLTWRFLLRGPEMPERVIQVSGRIEGDEAIVSTKTSGRIQEVRFREGDLVKAGEVIAILADDQIRAREDQARAFVDQADARVRLAQRQIGVLEQQLLQARLSVEQARTESGGRVSEAEASVAAAEAELAKAEAAHKLAIYDRQAYTKLASTGAVSERRGREAESAEETQGALVQSARKRVEAARGTLAATRAGLQNPQLRTAEAGAVQAQMAQARADIAAAQAEAVRARAQLEEARANRQDLQIVAPFAGTVTTRSAEPGEVATPGTAIVSLVDLNRLYMRGYVPEGQIGRVKLRQPVRVYLDSAPNTPLQAEVSRVDPQAAFTPENTYFREDRVKQVVGVKLQLKEGLGAAKPGMPADALVLVEGGEFPDVTPRR
ncbi:MAG TPA: HlyD family efflux transporter periplasmic adaptor subunit [Bryobacteraceae bacterium]|nr:HlyD family efflux transporter periplasmic adaptor subunit [Bryobacteraceae bacterium]